MKDDKLHVLRKSLVIITIILIVITAGISIVAIQTKTVTFEYFGNVKTVKTLASSVEEFLSQNKIYINDDMIVIPDISTNISNGICISVKSNKQYSSIDLETLNIKQEYATVKVVEEISEIPYEEETIDNSLIARGINKVKVDGKNGEKVSKFLVKYSGDTEVYRAKIDDKILTNATNKVIEVGTNLSTSTSRSQTIVIPKVDDGFKKYNISLPLEQQEYAYNLCMQYGLQYELFIATMYQESRFNPNAIGGGNSYGLSQIHISNLSNLSRKLGITNLLDPYDNIKAGVYMLALYTNSAKKISSDKDFIEVYGLNSYNMGEGNYYNNCYSKGIFHRGYSNSVRNIRDRLISTGKI